MPNDAREPPEPDPFEPKSDAIAVLMEEYRQVYGLALHRLNALESRIPIAGALLTTAVGAIVALPEMLQPLLLVGLPLTIAWFFRTTVQHARSFEDALRHIEVIERAVNARLGEELLGFQREHPSRGKYVGGRTGAESVGAVLSGSLLLLAACLYMAGVTTEMPDAWLAGYGLLLALLATEIIVGHARYWKYRARTDSNPRCELIRPNS